MKHLFWVAVTILLGVQAASATPLYRRPTRIDLGFMWAAYDTDLVTADFNNDGFPDLARSHETGKLSVALNDGSGPFTAALVTQVTAAQAMAAADMDSDGDQDLVMTSGGALYVFAGTGTGRFAAAGSYRESTVGRLVLTDVNGDGKMDAVMCGAEGGGYYDGVRVHFGDGTGALGPAVKTALNGGISDFTAADFDRDGKMDLLLRRYGGLRLLMGNGSGAFTEQSLGAISLGNPTGFTIGTFNADNIPDLAVTGQYQNPSHVSVYLGNGDGTFTPGGSYPYGGTALVCADVDNDGFNDIVAAGYRSTHFLKGTGTGAFLAPVYSPVVTAPHRPILRDFDRDGKLDLVTITEGIAYFYKGEGDGTFAEDRAFALQETENRYMSRGVAIDVNGDGRSDALTLVKDVSGRTGDLVVLRNDGGGGLLPEVRTPAPADADASRFIVGRLTADGAPVVVVFAGTTTAAPTATVFTIASSGAMTAGPVTTLAAPMEFYAPQSRLADMTGDGASDLLVGSWLYEGRRDGTFAPGRLHTVQFWLTGDLDGNGTNDTVWGGGDGTLTALNSGAAAFAAPVRIGRWPEDPVALADFNGDHRLDILGVSNDGLHLHPGRGDGTFGDVLFSSGDVDVELVHTADIDGDGDLDVLCGTAYRRIILLGDGKGRFRDVDPANLGFGDTDVGDFDGDRVLDLISFGGPITIALAGRVPQPGRPATVTMSSSTPEAQYAVPFSFRTTIEGHGGPVETGHVVYWSNDVPLGFSAVVPGFDPSFGHAGLTRAFPVGNHNVRAAYSGDQTYMASSVTMTQFVDRATPTLKAEGSYATYGMTANHLFQFRVPEVAYLPGVTAPAFTLESGGLPVSNTTWTATSVGVAGLEAGTYTFTLSYLGDSNYKPATSTVATVIARRTPAMSLIVTPTGRPLAGPITLEGRVGGPGAPGQITGTVTIAVEGQTPRTVALADARGSTTIPLAAGTYQAAADYSGDANNNPSSATAAVTVYAGAWGAVPVAIRATAAAGGTDIQWTPLTDASGYVLYMRTSFASAWQRRHSTLQTRVLDLLPAAGSTYMWAVVPLGPNGVAGTMSPPDIATNMQFTDDRLAAGSRIKAVHVTELRSGVNSVRKFAGLAPFTFTDAALAGLWIKSLHLQELGNALAEARSIIGMPLTYSGSSAAPGAVRAAHIEELRNGVK